MNDFGASLINCQTECNFDQYSSTSFYSISANNNDGNYKSNGNEHHWANNESCSNDSIKSQQVSEATKCSFLHLVSQNANDKHAHCCNDCDCKNDSIINNDKNRMNKKHKLDSVDEVTFSNTFTPRKLRQRLLLSLSNKKNSNSNDSHSNHTNNANVNSANNNDSINLFKNCINAINDQNKNDTSTKPSVFVFNYAPVQVSFLYDSLNCHSNNGSSINTGNTNSNSNNSNNNNDHGNNCNNGNNDNSNNSGNNCGNKNKSNCKTHADNSFGNQTTNSNNYAKYFHKNSGRNQKFVIDGFSGSRDFNTISSRQKKIEFECICNPGCSGTYWKVNDAIYAKQVTFIENSKSQANFLKYQKKEKFYCKLIVDQYKLCPWQVLNHNDCRIYLLSTFPTGANGSKPYSFCRLSGTPECICDHPAKIDSIGWIVKLGIDRALEDEKEEKCDVCDGQSPLQLRNGVFTMHYGFVSTYDVKTPTMIKQDVQKGFGFPLFCKFQNGLGIFNHIGAYSISVKNNYDENYAAWKKHKKRVKYIKNMISCIGEIPDRNREGARLVQDTLWYFMRSDNFDGLVTFEDGNGNILNGFCLVHGHSDVCVNEFMTRAHQRKNDNYNGMRQYYSQNYSCVRKSFQNSSIYKEYFERQLQKQTLRDIVKLDVFENQHLKNDASIFFPHNTNDFSKKLSKACPTEMKNINFGEKLIVYCTSPNVVFCNGYPYDSSHDKNSLGECTLSGYKHGMTDRGLRNARWAYIGRRNGLESYAYRIGYNEFLCCNDYSEICRIYSTWCYNELTDKNLKLWKNMVECYFGKKCFEEKSIHCLYPDNNSHLYKFKLPMNNQQVIIGQQCRECNKRRSIICLKENGTYSIVNDISNNVSWHSQCKLKRINKAMTFMRHKIHFNNCDDYSDFLKNQFHMYIQQSQLQSQTQSRLPNNKKDINNKNSNNTVDATNNSNQNN